MVATPIGLFALLGAVTLPSSVGFITRVPVLANDDILLKTFNKNVIELQQSANKALQAISDQLPVCRYENKKASCCATVGMNREINICGVLQVRPNELKVVSALVINGVQLAQQELSAGKLCYPYPPTPASACLHMYWVDVDLLGNKFEACFQGSVGLVATVDFQCVRYENGTFTRNANHQPDNQGFVNIRV